MRYYAGLDVSLEETAICIVDEVGRIERELRALSEPDALIDAFVAIGLPMERIGLEACSLVSWLHQGMARVGLPVLCIETRAAMGAMPNKTDRKRRYKRRNRIAIMFGRLKDWRRVATRYNRCPTAFFSAMALAATVIFWL